MRLARQLSHPFSPVFALTFAVILHGLRREPEPLRAFSEEALAVATEHGFAFWVAPATAWRGWALVEQGQPEEGLHQIRQGMTRWRDVGYKVLVAWVLMTLVEACGKTGRVDEGLCLVAEALAIIDGTGEGMCEAELHRLKGELLPAQGIPDERRAGACFQQAIEIARRQQAKSWELRAATSLSRLWQRQGKCAEARKLLAPIYS